MAAEGPAAKPCRSHPALQQQLAALAEVTLRNEHLNHILRMTIKTLASLTVAEAMDATKYDGARQLRETVKKLAKQKLGTCDEQLKLSAMITRAGRLTDKRNNLTHGLWAQELDGDPGVMGAPGELTPLPSAKELCALADELWALTKELNTARLEGFLKSALEARSHAP